MLGRGLNDLDVFRVFPAVLGVAVLGRICVVGALGDRSERGDSEAFTAIGRQGAAQAEYFRTTSCLATEGLDAGLRVLRFGFYGPFCADSVAAAVASISGESLRVSAQWPTAARRAVIADP